MGEVPRWVVVIVLSRDIMLVLGYFLLFTMTSSDGGAADPIGKFDLPAARLGDAVLVGQVWPGVVAPVVQLALFYVTGAVTATAGLQYMYRGLVWAQVRGDA